MCSITFRVSPSTTVTLLSWAIAMRRRRCARHRRSQTARSRPRSGRRSACSYARVDRRRGGELLAGDVDDVVLLVVADAEGMCAVVAADQRHRVNDRPRARVDPPRRCRRRCSSHTGSRYEQQTTARPPTGQVGIVATTSCVTRSDETGLAGTAPGTATARTPTAITTGRTFTATAFPRATSAYADAPHRTTLEL